MNKLWDCVKATTERALSCGALLSIPTNYEFVEQDGVVFMVRILSNLVRKDEAKKKEKQITKNAIDFNPFLPYEQDLWVADISDTHVCILNKFNVVDYHLLIITRAFEAQESLLTEPDFAAMWSCIADFDGLAFYNGGQIAGASQKHKHLQLVPLPLAPNGTKLPIEPLLSSVSFQGSVGTIPRLRFVHAFTRLNPDWVKSPIEGGIATLQLYHDSLAAVGLQDGGAYNLLATREWMLIIPRQHECFEYISVNSLGFAGALLVRNSEQLKRLKDYGPMNILKSVAIPL
ncbi:ATP adenylyltransferase [Dulcicalothrix desertica PCC 7102]|uniref:ATP adenylyltransferase n=1 Tax=Dulcicalothrix desertica PCC 7102 TaxID=232991 RepID=A0A433V2K9_9CYAN|nr:phosphorylase [Dulcicalothrix desertica]RUT00327.1 ATP adenylyltransferase [Dulcicalothrix desertica PCC 7102]TWH42440.1 ATP adenylyltransferase [Dulcicalothrix desertica PCC 7102]